MATSICLLGAVGVAVYGQARWLEIRAGEKVLEEAVPEIREALPKHTPSQLRQPVTVRLADDSEPNVFFYVTRSGHAVVASDRRPVPLSVLQQAIARPGFATFAYKGASYRAFRTEVARGGTVFGTAWVYAKIDDEEAGLRRLAHVILDVGGVAVLASAAVNLWLAARAIRPARATWQAYQESVTTLSHELQTPLATLQALILAPGIDEHTRQALRREIDHASSMVRDILYLSRLHPSLPAADPEPVAVSDVTEEMAARFTELAKARGLAFAGSAEPGLYVRTTPETWMRLVSTLLKNVIDHAAPHTDARWTLHAQGDMVVFETRNLASSPGAIPGPALDRGATRSVDRTEREAVRGQDAAHRGFGLRVVDRLVKAMAGKWSMTREGDVVVVTVQVPRLSPFMRDAPRTDWARFPIRLLFPRRPPPRRG